MCKHWEREVGHLQERERERVVMGMKNGGESRPEKAKGSIVLRPRVKLWMIRATSSVLLWTCLVQLTALGETWGPRLLKGWPSCSSQDMARSAPARVLLPPKSELPITIIVCVEAYKFD